MKERQVLVDWIRRENVRRSTRSFVIAALVAALGGCGAETASTAATGAAIKQREIEEGKKTMERAKNEIGRALDQVDQRAGRADGEK